MHCKRSVHEMLQTRWTAASIFAPIQLHVYIHIRYSYTFALDETSLCSGSTTDYSSPQASGETLQLGKCVEMPSLAPFAQHIAFQPSPRVFKHVRAKQVQAPPIPLIKDTWCKKINNTGPRSEYVLLLSRMPSQLRSWCEGACESNRRTTLARHPSSLWYSLAPGHNLSEERRGKLQTPEQGVTAYA